MASMKVSQSPKALVLVGGYGTRLRPLTFSKPKPLVEFAGKPILLHQLEALSKAGVQEVVLALSYMPHGFQEFLECYESQLGMKILVSKEDEALGTAGPLALAKNLLLGDDGSHTCPFFMLNSDVVCNFPFTDMMEHHLATNAEATLMVTRVEDPSRFGVAVMDSAGRVERFVEKPKEFVGNTVNGGVYVLSPTILEKVELRNMSIEKEVFPRVAEAKRLYGFVHSGYWMDVGQPLDYLAGVSTYLQHNVVSSHGSLPACTVIGNVLVDPSAQISVEATIGPDVVIGKNCKVEAGACVRNSVLLDGAHVCRGSLVANSIVGWKSKVGKWSRVVKGSVLGENVKVKDEVLINGAKVLPHKEVKEDLDSPIIVL